MNYRFAASAALPLLMLAACGKTPTEAPKSKPRAVSVGVIAKGPVDAQLSASGQLLGREEVAVTPDVSGYRVERVFVEEDANVRQGQILVMLDGGLLAPQIAQAAAQLMQQRVAAERSQAEAARVQGLEGKGVLSDEAIAERRIAVRSGAAQVASAQAQLDSLRTQQARLAVRAPRGGRILQRNVRPGDTSQTGTVMFTIARDGLVDLDAELPEASAGRVSVGMPATVIAADGTEYAGRVRLIGARVDPQTGAVKVRVGLPPSASLRPGGFAKAVFGTSGGASVASVPEAALRYVGSGAAVQIVGSDNRLRTVPVKTGPHFGGRVRIIQGPPVGTRVVLSGGAFLSDGDRITPVATR